MIQKTICLYYFFSLFFLLHSMYSLYYLPLLYFQAGIRCIDFHPYGDFLSSGSGDTNLKLWDIRRKGCIFTYKGHRYYTILLQLNITVRISNFRFSWKNLTLGNRNLNSKYEIRKIIYTDETGFCLLSEIQISQQICYV